MKGEARIRGPLESSLRGVSRPIFHPSRLLHGRGLHSLVDEDWLGDVLGHRGGRVGGWTAGVERAMSGAAEGCGKRQATSETRIAAKAIAITAGYHACHVGASQPTTAARPHPESAEEEKSWSRPRANGQHQSHAFHYFVPPPSQNQNNKSRCP